jgi:hypothetical protein
MSDMARLAAHHKAPNSSGGFQHYPGHSGMWHSPNGQYTNWQLAAAAAAAVQQQGQSNSQGGGGSQGAPPGPPSGWGGGSEGADLPGHHWLMGVISDAAKAGMSQAWQMRSDGRRGADPSDSSGAAQRWGLARACAWHCTCP